MEKMSGTVMHLWDAEAEIQRKKKNMKQLSHQHVKCQNSLAKLFSSNLIPAFTGSTNICILFVVNNQYQSDICLPISIYPYLWQLNKGDLLLTQSCSQNAINPGIFQCKYQLTCRSKISIASFANNFHTHQTISVIPLICTQASPFFTALVYSNLT